MEGKGGKMALGLPGSVRDPISVKQEEGRREGSAVKSRVVVEGLSLVLSAPMVAHNLP